MSEVVCSKSQEDYEDDFEKDLDWLIDEEGHSVDQAPEFKDMEAEIDKELEEDVKRRGMKRKEKRRKEEKKGKDTEELDEDKDEERWPSPMEPLEFDYEKDSPNKSSPMVPPPPGTEDQTDEEKKYILEKIQQANRELQDQETPDCTRRRRLHFKETLVDLVVPPLQVAKGENSGEAASGKERLKDKEAETVSGKLSELKLSPREERAGSGWAGECSDGGQAMAEDRVLVEKDGKFDLVSLKEMESQGLLPPIANNYGDFSSSRLQQQTAKSSKIHRSSPSSPPRSRAGSSLFKPGVHHLRAPRPPSQPRTRPCSATHSQGGSQRRGGKRRAQSAAGTPCQATYSLSPEQKELLHRIQERREKQAREAEQRRRDEEEHKKQENELAFKAWLMRKREKLQEERRVLRAQEMERMNSKRESSNSDSEEAFRLWLQRKQRQQQKERELVELKRLEEDSGYLLHSREESERAFKLWVQRKRAEKRAEKLAARERSRRLLHEERRARRMRDLSCAVNESKSLRFTEQLSFYF